MLLSPRCDGTHYRVNAWEDRFVSKTARHEEIIPGTYRDGIITGIVVVLRKCWQLQPLPIHFLHMAVWAISRCSLIFAGVALRYPMAWVGSNTETAPDHTRCRVGEPTKQESSMIDAARGCPNP